MRRCMVYFSISRKVMTWNALSHRRPPILVGCQFVSILDEMESERYLGRKLSFEYCQETELRNRLAAGWAAFHKHKAELCNKFYHLRDRIKLFEAVVSPSVLYGCAALALTQGMEKQLQVARRRMLRYVFRIHRRRGLGKERLEDWVHFVQHAAHRVDSIAEAGGMEDWVISARRRKWQFAGVVARKTDGRWSQRLIEWLPFQGHGRCQGRPKTGWVDSLEKFAGGDWMTLAIDKNTWDAYEHPYGLHPPSN